MSFVNALKDYIDHIDNLSSILENNFTIFVFVKSFFFYFANSLKLGFIYLISFQWLTDFIELPALFKHQYVAILEGKNFFSHEFETELDKGVFLFLDNSSFNSKNFGTGFMNSLFLALPFSVPHLLTIRAFLINGLPAGVSAAAGTIFGQTIFFSCILFGFEFIILPFLHFESLTIILGLFLLVNLFYKMIHRPNMAVVSLDQKNELLKLFGLNFLLAWTEQTCVFGYFGNLTIDGSPNLLQTGDTKAFFLTQFLYLGGLVLGSISWTALFSFFVISLRNIISNTIAITTSFIILNERIHYFTVFLTAVFAFNTIPYYGFDYIFYNGLGFISSDKALNAISPKMYYAVNIGKTQREFTMNSLPFDKPYDKTTQELKSKPLKYEQYSLDSENLWKNKFSIKESLNMVTSEKQVYKSTKNLTDDQLNMLSKYENHDLIVSSDRLSTKEQVVDQLLKTLFRRDVYVGYNDVSSNSKFLGQTKVHRQFRNKYYTNPVYKALVNIDMRPFLAGQPKNYNLTAEDEFELFRRRIILQNYLDSIHDYKACVKKETQSYAETVYNQQFKGSLSLTRHFSAINFLSDLNSGRDQVDQSTKKILKYDQLLYNEKPQTEIGLLHEELDNYSNSYSKYMILNNSAPFYVGWDGALRKFIIKTASVPDQISTGDESYSKPLTTEFPNYFSFQAWSPALEKTTQNLNTKFQLPSLNISDYNLADVRDFLGLPKLSNKQSSKKKIDNEFVTEDFIKKLPTFDWHWRESELSTQNGSKHDLLNIQKAIPPRLDGIAWPGIQNQQILNKLNLSSN